MWVLDSRSWACDRPLCVLDKMEGQAAIGDQRTLVYAGLPTYYDVDFWALMTYSLWYWSTASCILDATTLPDPFLVHSIICYLISLYIAISLLLCHLPRHMSVFIHSHFMSYLITISIWCMLKRGTCWAYIGQMAFHKWTCWTLWPWLFQWLGWCSFERWR